MSPSVYIFLKGLPHPPPPTPEKLVKGSKKVEELSYYLAVQKYVIYWSYINHPCTENLALGLCSFVHSTENKEGPSNVYIKELVCKINIFYLFSKKYCWALNLRCLVTCTWFNNTGILENLYVSKLSKSQRLSLGWIRSLSLFIKCCYFYNQFLSICFNSI